MNMYMVRNGEIMVRNDQSYGKNGNFMVRNDWYEMSIIQSDWLIILWPRLTISFERHNGNN